MLQLARDISAVVGGASQTSWLTVNIAIMTSVLGPPVCQAADYWGRRWFLIILSSAGIVGCIVVSRAESVSFSQGALPKYGPQSCRDQKLMICRWES